MGPAGPPRSSSRTVAGRPVGDDSGAHALLGHGLRLAQGRGEAERAAAIKDRDRRGRHPLHPRKSRHENALPLIMTHGWPGSVIELLEVVGPLTDPTAHGGAPRTRSTSCCRHCPVTASPASRRARLGRRPHRRAWAELMNRLGYTRYVAQGGDQGASVTDAMARQAPNGLVGNHLNLLSACPQSRGASPAESEQEDRAASRRAATSRRHGPSGATSSRWPARPQTIGYALTDTPVGLAAWMLDHDADSYEKISRAFVDGQPSGGLTRDRIVDNITLYWLTNTATSSARLVLGGPTSHSLRSRPGRSLPSSRCRSASPSFPGEIFESPRSWAEKVYPNLTYFNEADRGGHFAAWEEPQLFAEEMRAAFRSLRNGGSS